MALFWRLIALFIVVSAIFIGISLLQGYSTNVKNVPCGIGECIMNPEGSEKICPANINDIVVPNYRYSQCVPSMGCSVTGGGSASYAVHQDGSALTSTCDVPGCPCSIYRRCPPYILSLFRPLGAEDRISYFQVLDTLYPKVSNPFSPPYIIDNTTDECFMTLTQIPSIYPSISAGSQCFRGVFAKIASKDNTYGCVTPGSKYFNSSTNVFNDVEFLADYKA